MDTQKSFGAEERKTLIELGKLENWKALYRRMRDVAAGYSNQCDESGTSRRLDREFAAIEADATNLASEPKRDWT
jgi:hypothetical protein